jgi:diadenosine tetraphosphate (Ap4A) HIT family hydrolase
MIIKNEFARATAGGSFREGHCVVTVKRHMISPSEMNPEEWSATFELISKVSKALEEKYGVRKTYVMMIGDSKEWQHLHFHLIPKHHHLPSMGVYCIQKLEEAEGTFDTTPEQKKELANELKTLL